MVLDEVKVVLVLFEEELEWFMSDIIMVFKIVYDFEIFVDIYELGFIYKIDILDDCDIDIEMIFIVFGCLVVGEMLGWV